MKRKLIDFFKIIRWKNVLIFLFLQSLMFYFVKPVDILAFSLTVFLLTLIGIAGNIHNNILDYSLDRYKSDFVTFDTGKYYKVIVFLLFIFLFFIPWLYSKTLIVVVLVAVLFGIFFYNKYLKKYVIIGNICVATVVAISVLLPSLAGLTEYEPYKALMILLFASAFVTTWLRELVKDMEDKDFDERFNYKTLPVISMKMSKILYFLLLFVLFAVLFVYFKHFNPLIFSILTILLSFLSVYLSISVYKERYQRATRIVKLMMLLGIIFSLYGIQNIG